MLYRPFLLVNSVPNLLKRSMFKMGKTAQICCIYTFKKNSAAETGSAAGCGSGNYFVHFHVCYVLLRYRSRNNVTAPGPRVILFRSQMRSRRCGCRHIFVPEPHHDMRPSQRIFIKLRLLELRQFSIATLGT
jgi:hypothetical protein